ncbi:MAG: hypothetical protein LBB24_01140 [Rickettsiales bacterium]|jgi:uncharacterized membrane protein|nr:hypothetical protein [Rickettsiales bacterium]
MINTSRPNEGNDDSRENFLLPPPDILVKYKNSGMGRELIDFVRREQEYRHELEINRVLNHRIGQWLGFAVYLFFFGGIFRLVGQGHTEEAYIVSALFCSLVLVAILMTRRAGGSFTGKRSGGALQPRDTRQRRTDQR